MLIKDEVRRQDQAQTQALVPIQAKTKVQIQAENIVGSIDEAFDPAYRSLKKLNISLYDNQIQILESVLDWNVPYLIVVAARGSGKTAVLGVGLLQLCLDEPGLMVGVFAPKWAQANRVVEEMTKLIKSSNVSYEVDWKKTTGSKLTFKNGSTVICQSASEATEGEGWHFHIILCDESLHRESKILCEDGKKRSISRIVGRRMPIKVLTYNIEKNNYEFSEIKNYFSYPCTKECYEVEYEVNGKNTTLKCTADHQIYTKNRGYVEAQHLTTNDEIVLSTKFCAVCGKEFVPKDTRTKTCCEECRKKLISQTEHKRKEQLVTLICKKCKKEHKVQYKYRNKVYCKDCLDLIKKNRKKVCLNCSGEFIGNPKRKFCSMKCNKEYRKKNALSTKTTNKCFFCNKEFYFPAFSRDKRKFCSMDCYTKYRDIDPKMLICDCGKTIKNKDKVGRRFCSEECATKAREAQVKNMSILMKKNPEIWHNEKANKKRAKTWRKTWDKTPEEEKIRRINIFKNAPMYTRGKITKPEKKIIDLNIKDLSYTGNGAVWVEFNNGKHKNPDFKYRNEPYVIEVGDFEYWHTKKERKKVIKNYKAIGYRCLYLDAKDVNKYDNTILKDKIERFLKI